MPAKQRKCPSASCQYETPAHLQLVDQHEEDIRTHMAIDHLEAFRLLYSTSAGSGSSSKPEKIPRPEIDEGSTEADFAFFQSNWLRYKRSTNLDANACIDQLLACCSSNLHRAVYNSDISSEITEKELLSIIRRLSVRAQNVLVNRVTFLKMSQNKDESVESYVSRLRGQAGVCNYNIDCGSLTDHEVSHSYSEKMIADQLVVGLHDTDIQEQVLAHASDNPNMDLASIQKFVAAKESGRISSSLLSKSTVSKMSEYKMAQRKLPSVSEETGHKIENPQHQSQDGACNYCGHNGHGTRAPGYVRQKKCPAFKVQCDNCSKVGHFKKMCRSKPAQVKETDVTTEAHEASYFMNMNSTFKNGKIIRSLPAIPHHDYDKLKGWILKRPQPHAYVEIQMSLCKSSYQHFKVPVPKAPEKRVRFSAMTDTGAQIVVASTKEMSSIGIRKTDLIPMANQVSTADDSRMGILGGMFVNISGHSVEGKKISTKCVCYIARGVKGLYISKSICKQLGILSQNFPLVGEFIDDEKIGSVAEVSQGENEKKDECNCPKRTLPPPAPTKLPFPPTKENVAKLKEWIENYYASSAFNQCPHQPLPLMKSSSPMKLHISPDAKPVAVHKPIPLPLHWMKPVKEGLDKDEKLGVI